MTVLPLSPVLGYQFLPHHRKDIEEQVTQKVSGHMELFFLHASTLTPVIYCEKSEDIWSLYYVIHIYVFSLSKGLEPREIGQVHSWSKAACPNRMGLAWM